MLYLNFGYYVFYEFHILAAYILLIYILVRNEKKNRNLTLYTLTVPLGDGRHYFLQDFVEVGRLEPNSP